MQHEGQMARDEVFARWYQAHHDRIRALCARILRDPSAAEDMAQETLLRAWQRRDQMREEDLGAWLSVVARNLCLSAIRKEGRLIVTDELPEKADLSADPAIEVGRRESRRNVRRALGKLGERNRRVIDLHEVREANYEEIGSELGVSAEGARAIAFRARRVLREHLAAVGEGLGSWIVMVRVRLRGAADRMMPSVRQIVEGGLSPAFQVGLGLAIATAVTFGGSSAVDRRSAASGTVAGGGSASLGSSVQPGSIEAKSLPSENPASGSAGGDQAGPSVRTGLDTDDDPSVNVETWAPNPITGPETGPIVTIWFNDKGPVTPRLIRAYGAICSRYGDRCDEIGRTIPIGEGP